MELSFEIANHLTNYINDYNYINSKDKSVKVLRKGEIRDQFGSVSALNNKDDNSSIDNANKNSKVKIIYQSIENLHYACPNHTGDWYFTGNYPTPGGNRVVNNAFINFYEGNKKRAY